MMGRCVWFMLPGSLTVARAPYASTVKDMAPPPAKPRRVSAVLYPLPNEASEDPPLLRLCACGPHPILWGDWSRTQPRRAWIGWLRSHLVLVRVSPMLPPLSTPSSPLSRAQRAHWRLTRQQRLQHNARPSAAPPVEITIYGLSPEFAQILGLLCA